MFCPLAAAHFCGWEDWQDDGDDEEEANLFFPESGSYYLCVLLVPQKNKESFSSSMLYESYAIFVGEHEPPRCLPFEKKRETPPLMVG